MEAVLGVGDVVINGVEVLEAGCELKEGENDRKVRNGKSVDLIGQEWKLEISTLTYLSIALSILDVISDVLYVSLNSFYSDICFIVQLLH